MLHRLITAGIAALLLALPAAAQEAVGGISGYGPLSEFLDDHSATWASWSGEKRLGYVQGFMGAVQATSAWHWEEFLDNETNPIVIRFATEYAERYSKFVMGPPEQVAEAIGALYEDSLNAIIPVFEIADIAIAAAAGADPKPLLISARDRIMGRALMRYNHDH